MVPTARLVHLAVADGRGHLMRAHLLRRLLADRGFEVDIVTPPRRGAFLAGLGTPPRCCPAVSRSRSTTGTTCSLPDRSRAGGVPASPWRLGRDVALFRQLSRGRVLVVNDSLHPAALCSRALVRGWGARVVHLFGENLWQAAVSHFDGRLPRGPAPATAGCSRAVRARAFGRVVHSLAPPIARASRARRHAFACRRWCGRRGARARRSVRALGLDPGDASRQCTSTRTSAIRPSPTDSRPRLRRGFRHLRRRRGLGGAARLAGVGCGVQRRDGGGDLFVSGAGTGALDRRGFGPPMLALLGDQPEQARNLAPDARQLGVRRRLRAAGRRSAMRWPRSRARGGRRARGQRRLPPLPSGATFRVAHRAGEREAHGTQARRPRSSWRPTTCTAGATTPLASR